MKFSKKLYSAFLLSTLAPLAACRQQLSTPSSNEAKIESGNSTQNEKLKELNGKWIIPCMLDANVNFMEETSLLISEGNLIVTKIAYNSLSKCDGEILWEVNSPARIQLEGPSPVVDGASNITVVHKSQSVTPKSEIGLSTLKENNPQKSWALNEATETKSKEDPPASDIYKIVQGKLCFGKSNSASRPVELEPLYDCPVKKKSWLKDQDYLKNEVISCDFDAFDAC